VARQTRAQRRARREQQAASEAQAAPRGGRPRQPAVRPVPEPAVAGPARGQQRGGVRRFVSESWGELQKVEWPTQNQLIQGVVVVVIACLVVGVFLWGADLVFKRLVENVLLR
jgi:preprotein translocase subunit SecE